MKSTQRTSTVQSPSTHLLKGLGAVLPLQVGAAVALGPVAPRTPLARLVAVSCVAVTARLGASLLHTGTHLKLDLARAVARVRRPVLVRWARARLAAVLHGGRCTVNIRVSEIKVYMHIHTY